MIDWLAAPFAYEFMVRATLAALLVGIVCPLIGCYVVVRGLAFFGDALSHSVSPGVVIASLIGASLLLGGLVAGVVVAMGIGLLARRTRLDDQTAIGVVFPVALAAGVALLAARPTFAADLTHILFGSLLGVSAGDLGLTAVVAAIVVAALVVLHRPLTAMTFDPVAARLQGVPVEALHVALLVLLALAIVIAIQTAGNLLVLSLLVTPAATAWLVARSMLAMVLVAPTLGVVASVGGVLLSFHLGVPIGPAVVLLAAAEFGAVAGVTHLVGHLRRRTARPLARCNVSEYDTPE
ncbi:MAG: membrane protein [Dehalococcoidia bacterium]|nr:MAG: membrane protein [Dehalococcoidia bacterium]